MAQWGSSTTNENKPNWKFLQGDLKNVFATGKGWVRRWPWGDEVLVAIGKLSTKLGVASIANIGLELLSLPYISNTSNRSVRVRVLFNEPVTVSGTPTLSLTSNGATANVVLAYESANSTPNTGALVFANTTVAAQTFTVGSGYFANASSVLTGWENIKDAGTANAVANAVVGTLAIPVKQHVPVHTRTQPIAASVAANTETVIGFWIGFNQAVTVNGVPTIVARGNANTGNANVVISYVAAESNVAAGNLVFKSEATDLSAIVANGVFTVNSTSTLANWAAIRNDIDGTPANALAVANTIIVTV